MWPLYVSPDLSSTSCGNMHACAESGRAWGGVGGSSRDRTWCHAAAIRLARLGLHRAGACVRACMHACVRACVVRACVRACMHACVRACLRACVRACVHACVCACVRACLQQHAPQECVHAHAGWRVAHGGHHWHPAGRWPPMRPRTPPCVCVPAHAPQSWTTDVRTEEQAVVHDSPPHALEQSSAAIEAAWAPLGLLYGAPLARRKLLLRVLPVIPSRGHNNTKVQGLGDGLHGGGKNGGALGGSGGQEQQQQRELRQRQQHHR